jgi:predicted amidohydrolase YtcJ
MSADATLLIRNARVWSGGSAVADADAVAVAGARILAVGREADLRAHTGPAAEVIDARGGTVTPGFTDAHIHLVRWARARAELQIDPYGSRADALAAVRDHLARHPNDRVVVGRGWASDRWDAPPDRAALDSISDGRPVILHSRDFHAVWVNSVALERAGLSRATRDPDDGRYERDARGELTGVAREHAVRPLTALEEPISLAADLDRVRFAMECLLAYGITAVHDFEGAAEFALLETIAKSQGPRVRVLMHLPHDGLEQALEERLISGTGDDWFRIGAVKLFADGTLGSRTAALLAPYLGTDERGMELMSGAELRATAERAIAGGLSIAVHAIGDRAVRSVLDAVAAVPQPVRARLGLPPRIEHAQLVSAADLPRFAELGVVASMQPSHCVTDIPLAGRDWADRLDFAYPWASLRDGGALLAFGSDAPVEPPDPSLGLQAALTRATREGQPPGGFVPAQRIALDSALSAYTDAPARIAGGSGRWGVIAPGAWADLVVWDADLAQTPAADLHRVRPHRMVLEGRGWDPRSAQDAAPVDRGARGG